MQILFISTHFPQNLQSSVEGTFQRVRLFIDAMKEIAQLDMLFYVPPDIDYSPDTIAQLEDAFAQHWHIKVNLFLCPRATPLLQPKWKAQLNGIWDFFQQSDFSGTSSTPQIQALEACLDRKPDVIFAHKLQSMCPLMLTQQTLPPILFDLDDIEHIRFMRQIRQPPTRLRTLLYYLQIPSRWWGEYRAIRLAEQTFVCSELDYQYLSKKWGLSGVVSVPNAITIPDSLPLQSEPTLLLIGGYYYSPNINAANFLIEQVWPQIYEQIPHAKLIIAGKEPQNIRSYTKNAPGVEFTGFVNDLKALYQRSRVVCCPIFSGGGTRVKMIEAAAYGKPIVATRIGAEGLNMVDGQDFLLRNHPQAFAEACLALLQDDILCMRLGSNARKTAIQHYDRSSIVQNIQHYVQVAARLPIKLNPTAVRHEVI